MCLIKLLSLKHKFRHFRLSSGHNMTSYECHKRDQRDGNVFNVNPAYYKRNYYGVIN